MDVPASYWIETLQLEPHIEGGAYKSTYRSSFKLAMDSLPEGFSGERHICSSIYFLLQKGEFSAFHRLRSDEIWHFYFGDALVIYEIDADGKVMEHKLGSNPKKGENFQCTIKAGNWLAAKVQSTGNYCLAGCTVSPGFDFADFELGKRSYLIQLYPNHKALIESMTAL